MSQVNIQPVKFIKQGSELEVRFIGEDDKLQWYRGIVQKVHRFGEDDVGAYVDCDVLYEDGEHVTHAVFYSKDFDEENTLDAWRFSGNISLLISFMIKNTAELQSLKDEIRMREDNIRKLIEDTLNDMDDDDYELDEDEDEDDEDDEEDEDDEDDEDEDEEDVIISEDDNLLRNLDRLYPDATKNTSNKCRKTSWVVWLMLQALALGVVAVTTYHLADKLRPR